MSDDGGWAAFYASMRGRRPRAPFGEALALIEQPRAGPGVAADIGCGDGTEAREAGDEISASGTASFAWTNVAIRLNVTSRSAIVPTGTRRHLKK